MLLDVLIALAVVAFLWWLAERLVCDVLDDVDDAWTRAFAHEEIGREADERRRA